MFAPSANHQPHAEIIFPESDQIPKKLKNRCFGTFLRLSSQKSRLFVVCSWWFHEGAALYPSNINVLDQTMVDSSAVRPASRQIGQTWKGRYYARKLGTQDIGQTFQNLAFERSVGPWWASNWLMLIKRININQLEAHHGLTERSKAKFWNVCAVGRVPSFLRSYFLNLTLKITLCWRCNGFFVSIQHNMIGLGAGDR